MTWFIKVTKHVEKNTHSVQCEVMDWLRKTVFCKFMGEEKVNKGTITILVLSSRYVLLDTVGYDSVIGRFFLPAPLQLFLGYYRQRMGTVRSVTRTDNR